MLNKEFYLLAQECDLAKASLLGAMTAFSYLDVSQTGTMYSAFFQAAIGLERLMKLVVIISHNVKHDLSNPTNEHLREIGHDLVVLYDKCFALAAELSLGPSQWFQGDSLERQMLVFLSTFAKASRYYNLNAIAGSNKAKEPVADWVHLHQRIADEYIPYKVKEKLNAEAIQNAEGLNAYGYSRWVDGQHILVVDGMYLHALLTRSNPYCVWILLRGGEGIIAESNRDEQRKAIKYNHLVANCLIFHNLCSLARLVQTLEQRGDFRSRGCHRGKSARTSPSTSIASATTPSPRQKTAPAGLRVYPQTDLITPLKPNGPFCTESLPYPKQFRPVGAGTRGLLAVNSGNVVS